MEQKPIYKKCDRVWFLKPNGKFGHGLVSKVSKVTMNQTTISNGRSIDCVMFLYDIHLCPHSFYEEELFASEEELLKAIKEEYDDTEIL